MLELKTATLVANILKIELSSFGIKQTELTQSKTIYYFIDVFLPI